MSGRGRGKGRGRPLHVNDAGSSSFNRIEEYDSYDTRRDRERFRDESRERGRYMDRDRNRDSYRDWDRDRNRDRDRERERDWNRDRIRTRDRDSHRDYYQLNNANGDNINDDTNSFDQSRSSLGRGRGRGRGRGVNLQTQNLDQYPSRGNNSQSQAKQNYRSVTENYNSYHRDEEKNNSLSKSPVKSSYIYRTTETTQRKDEVADNPNSNQKSTAQVQNVEDADKEIDSKIQELNKQLEKNSKNDDNLDPFLFSGEIDQEEQESILARRRRQKRKHAALAKFKQEEVITTEKQEDLLERNKLQTQISAGRESNTVTKIKEYDEHTEKKRSIFNELEANNGKDKLKSDDDSDGFDMFSDSVTPPTETKTSTNNNNEENKKTLDIKQLETNNNDDYCDAEGYYKPTIGEIINFTNTDPKTQSFKVLGIKGKGVFSTVLQCNSINDPDKVVAIKLIRNNETMAKAAQKELRILRLIQNSNKPSSTNSNQQHYNHYIVKLLEIPTVEDDFADGDIFSSSSTTTRSHLPLEFRNHTAFVFEYLPFTLRQVLTRFGSGVGINLQAVQSYFRQLLAALKHLTKYNVLHADIKPGRFSFHLPSHFCFSLLIDMYLSLLYLKTENILVSADYSLVKLADFGSAFFITDGDNLPTPYLVSRFYRPPEVILGLEYNHFGVDLWSVAVTCAELFTGRVLFPGHTNNDMIRLFMETLGPFSPKMIKRHVRSYQERMNLDPFFNTTANAAGDLSLFSNNTFRQQAIDKVTQKPVVKIVPMLTKPLPKKQLTHLCLKSCTSGNKEERFDVLKYADLLVKCLALDPSRRITVEAASKHPFFVSTNNKTKNEQSRD